MNLNISPGMVIWPQVVLIVGLSMIFVSINVAAFKYIRPICAGPPVSLFAFAPQRGAASARPCPRLSNGDATISTRRASANSSIPSTRS